MRNRTFFEFVFGKKLLRLVFFCSLYFNFETAVSQVSDNNFFLAIEKNAILIKTNETPLITIDSINFNYIAASTLSVLYSSDDSSVIELQYLKVPEFNMIDGALDRTVKLTITRKEGSFHFVANAPWAGRCASFSYPCLYKKKFFPRHGGDLQRK